MQPNNGPIGGWFRIKAREPIQVRSYIGSVADADGTGTVGLRRSYPATAMAAALAAGNRRAVARLWLSACTNATAWTQSQSMSVADIG
jgi:hypothetical protein